MSQENSQASVEEEQASQSSPETQPESTTQTAENDAMQAETEQNNQTQNEQSEQDANEHEVADELAALKAEELIKKVREAQEKADKNWDIALRAKAEMDNVRRRSEKEIANARKFGIEKLANELLPVKDSMEMGIKAVQEIESKDEATAKILEGMEMTLKMMGSAMDKIGIKEIAPEVGEAFNPEFHQAMSMQEVEGAKSNTIVSAFQKGYTLNNRLMRPAMVMVAK